VHDYRVDHQFLCNHLCSVKKRLVLFDFDGTITTKDTFLEFIRFYHGSFRYWTGLLILSPVLALFILKLIPNYRAKEVVLKWFFKGEPEEVFNRKSKTFCERILPLLIRPKALDEISAHILNKSNVVIISASAENWVAPWCLQYNLHCLATRLEVRDGKLTGNIAGVNCYGPEKERRIRECYVLQDFDEVLAYGDSRGDFEMLALAHKQYYRPFR
jgi:phosphatidylglycerophosphatase C